jgi:hypothetical protein
MSFRIRPDASVRKNLRRLARRELGDLAGEPADRPPEAAEALVQAASR